MCFVKHASHILRRWNEKMGRLKNQTPSIDGVFSFQNNPKIFDPSYKMDVDLWDSLGRVTLKL